MEIDTQKVISWPILDKFAPNLCADKYGEYKSHKRPIIALFFTIITYITGW